MSRPPSSSAVRVSGSRSGAGGLSWLAAAGFAALGLATSVLLIPGDYERALQEIQAGELEHAIVRLGGMRSRGDASPAVAAALSFAQAEQGELQAAVLSLEAIASSRPKDMSILQALADLYFGVGRMAEHVAILERQQAIARDEKRQEQIVALHEKLGQVGPQRAALWTLVQTYEPTRSRYLDLARLESADGQALKAIQALNLQRAAYPYTVDADAVSLAVALELTLGEDEKALERSRDWLDRQPLRSGPIQTLADVFQTQQRPDLLVALVAPLAVDGAPLAIFETLAEAYHRNGDRRAAGDVLERLESLGGSRPQIAQARLRIAYAIGDSRGMLAAAREVPVEAIPEAMMKGVATGALARRDAEYLRLICEAAGPRLFERDPVLAARVSIALHDLDAARSWVEVARADGDGDPALLLGAAEIDFQLARATRSVRTLRDIFGEAADVATAMADKIGGGDAFRSAQEEMPRDMLAAAAGLYVQLGIPEEGRAVLGAYRRAFPSPESDLAWALVSAASKASGDARVLQAASSGGKAASPEFLDQLASTALNAGAFDLAASAASRLVSVRGSDADKMLMAQAMISASRPLHAAATVTLP